MGESELYTIERDLGRTLPNAYRKFVLYRARAAADRLEGLDVAPARLPANREYADYLLRVSKADYSLSPADVVFLFQQDYQFFFFRCTDSDDPPVFSFSEGKRWPTEVAPSFTKWVDSLLT